MVIHVAVQPDGSIKAVLEDAGHTQPFSLGAVERLISARLNGDTKGSFKASLEKGTVEVGDRVELGAR